MRVAILGSIVLAFAAIAGCSGSGNAPRDPSIQRRSDLPAHTDSSPVSEKGAQSISREPHSRAGYAPKNGK